MSGEYGDNAQLQHEPILPGGPFVFSLASGELEKIVRDSELSKPAPESSSGDKPENLYEQLPDLAYRLEGEKRSGKPEVAPGELTGRYLIPRNGTAALLENKIGEGQTAEVYLCHDPQEDK